MSRKLFLNTLTSLMLQVVTLVCGFIVPRLFLSEYGSQINGLVQSVSEFLGIISFLELGVGQVIQSTLYKPLAQKDMAMLSAIISSGNKFFKRIAWIFVGYIACLSVCYPLIVGSSFTWIFTVTLILALGIGLFAQYYFGITDRILLNADQKGYIQYSVQIATLIANTVMCVIFVNLGATIQIVKMTTSLIYLVRPFVLRLYVNKNYKINRHAAYSGEPIAQMRNGMAQHISAVILNGTDNIVLTIFSTLSNVSIYSVYHLVVYGVHQVYQSLTAGLHSMVGDLIARQELDKLRRYYSIIEPGLHLLTVWLFTCTGILIIPFVEVYTKDIVDANYIQPIFSVLIVLAHAIQSIKTTYNMLILGAGHYKQAQKCHVVTAIINLIISIVTVSKFGLIGVAIGTVAAMTYQTLWMALYNSKQIINWPFISFIKQLLIDLLAVGVIILLTFNIKLEEITYWSWIVMAIKVASVATFVIFILIILFYSKTALPIIKGLTKKEKQG